MRHLPQLVGLCLLASLSNTAMAGWVLFHQQGQPGQREAYFAEITRTTERTEVDQMLGSGNGTQARTSVWEMPVMVVHESADAPEPVLRFPLRLKGRLESPPLRLDIDSDVAKQ